MVLLLALVLQDQAAVDAAVRKGADWLKTNGAVPAPAGDQIKPPRDPLAGGSFTSARELVLLALWHAGVRENDPFFAARFAAMLEEPPGYTYRTALQAMLLEAMDPKKYQARLRDCAQVLVDNQCANGTWDYGGPVPADGVATGAKKKVETSVAKGAVQKRRPGGPAGDHSNSQYGALGLRACHDAGILLPRDVLERAVGAWKSYRTAKGWFSMSGAGVQSRLETGSMAAGAAGSLVIYDHLMGIDWKTDPDVALGLKWLEEHWSVAGNPSPVVSNEARTVSWFVLYYLYGIERLGRLTGADRIGAHDWYGEGAKAILEKQCDDGSWIWEAALSSSPDAKGPKFVDTCFAILFLTRATRPLVPSVDPKKNQ